MTVIHYCPACGAMFTGSAHQCLPAYPVSGLARQPEAPS